MKRLALAALLLCACNPPEAPGQGPTVSLRMSSVVMNAIDTADQRKMLGGSQGDGLARDARARFETAR